jgi:hypothetical protein
MVKKIDFSKLKEPQKNYLSEQPKITNKEQESKQAKGDVSAKNTKIKKKQAKVGRPTIEKEPLNSPLTLNFTEKEYNIIKEKAGLAPLTSYLREIIKKSGVI